MDNNKGWEFADAYYSILDILTQQLKQDYPKYGAACEQLEKAEKELVQAIGGKNQTLFRKYSDLRDLVYHCRMDYICLKIILECRNL